jgi:putative tryptophan/tyrosine transport system substrate-binding protein
VKSPASATSGLLETTSRGGAGFWRTPRDGLGYHRAAMLSRRRFLGLMNAGLLTAPLAAEAQPSAKIWRVGVLRLGRAETTETLRQALRDLGYVEGRNLVIEDRTTDGRLDRLSGLAAQLVRLNVDVIVASGVAGTRAAKQATKVIPIVMLATDPLGAGLIESLARPGGNITGVATLESELGAKRLEHFKEAFPAVTRVAALYDPTTSPTVLKEFEEGGRRLQILIHVIVTRAPEELDGAFKQAAEWRATALSILASPFFQAQRTRIAKLAIEHRLPTMVPHRAYVEAGGLMSYGPDFRDLGRRTAIFVDKILKGAKPAQLPVEQATKFELVINLQTAKKLSLTIPPSLLLRADQIIE